MLCTWVFDKQESIIKVFLVTTSLCEKELSCSCLVMLCYV